MDAQWQADREAGPVLATSAEFEREAGVGGTFLERRVHRPRLPPPDRSTATCSRSRCLTGSRFDRRALHDAVLDNGGVPLPLLEQQIYEYIVRAKAAP